MTESRTGLIHAVTGVSCLRHDCGEPISLVSNGEIVIRYGGWSLRQLSDDPLVREQHLMLDDHWYYKHKWSNQQLPNGVYRLRIPVPGSNGQTFAQQTLSLPSNEEPAPVVLVATALLAYRLQVNEELLGTNLVRCKELTIDGTRVELQWWDGQLKVHACWDAFRFDFTWLSSVRKF